MGRKSKLKKTKTKPAKKHVAPAAVTASVAAAKKRKSIDIAIPSAKLWVCKIGRHKIAFIKGHRNLPLGVITKQKKRGKTETLLTVRPFDSTEHEHVISHLCK